MDRWIRFVVVLVVLLGMLGVGSCILLNQLQKLGEEDPDPLKLTNPLYGARVGDWAEFRKLGGLVERRTVIAQGTYERRTVATSTDLVVLGVGYRADDSQPWTMTDDHVWSRSCLGLGSKFVLESITRDDIEHAGREWRSWKVEGHYPGVVGAVEAWITDQHPLGVLKIKSKHKRAGLDQTWFYEYLRHGYDLPEGDSGGPEGGARFPPRDD